MKILYQTLMVTVACGALAGAAHAGYDSNKYYGSNQNSMYEKHEGSDHHDSKSMKHSKHMGKHKGKNVIYDTLDHSEVWDVQKSLNRYGYDISMDGQWGPRTTAAIQAFQRQQNLKVTGDLDAQTLAALDVTIKR